MAQASAQEKPKIEIYRPRTLVGSYLGAWLGGLYSLEAPPLAPESLALAGLLFFLGLATALTRKGSRQTFQVICGTALFWGRSYSGFAKNLLAQAAAHGRLPILMTLWASFFLMTLFCVRREATAHRNGRPSDARL
jgi:hypothetical protein